MKNLPVGIQTFREIIENGYLYVDKTREIFNLVAKGGKYYFVSRPRRFGKSLMLSTLSELFAGNRDLFKELWIEDKIQWQSYPLIYIDFLGKKYGNPEELTATLNYLLEQNARKYGVILEEEDYDKRFNELIGKLSEKGKVVVLVDEYDKPIINHIERPETARLNREVLKTFYEVIKGCDGYIKFAFITGVSKFSKVSIFSSLNNLDDITVDDRFSTLFGFTHHELKHYFKERMDNLNDEEFQQIGKWYNGYSWDGKNFLYNPFSVLQFFNKGKFGNYWFSTGTPSFLIQAIREHKIDVRKIENYRANKLLLDSFDFDRMNVFTLLFQTGYLTIKEVDESRPAQPIYRLSYPNEEVREAFLDYLAADFTGKNPEEFGYLVHRLQESIEAVDFDAFFNDLKAIFAAIPYDIFINEREAYYHTVIYLIMKLIGINIDVEVETNTGRIDCVIKTASHIFIMEFKMGIAAEAITQIKEKKYFQKFQNQGKEIRIIGVGFETEQKNITNYLIESI